jgi:hypothetical protein
MAPSISTACMVLMRPSAPHCAPGLLAVLRVRETAQLIDMFFFHQTILQGPVAQLRQ